MSKRSLSSRWVVTGREVAKALLVFALFLTSSIILQSCATNAPIQNVTLSYNAVKTVTVNTLPAGLRLESSNGRMLTSGYFDPQTLKAARYGAKVQAYVVVTILGSSRPYSIDVHAFTEEKTEDGYVNRGEDLDLTDRLAERLRSALANRREDRNVIDDFRAF